MIENDYSSEDKIEIQNAHEHNLKNINLTIPKNKIVVFTGVSGSGKSSLVFDTLAVESNRQWQSSYSQYIRNKMPHYARPQVDSIKNLTPSIVIRQQTLNSNSRSTVGTMVDTAPLMRLLFSRIGHPSAGGSMSYSTNHPLGMCPTCTGLGKVQILNEESLFDTSKSINEGAIKFSQFNSGWQSYIYSTNSLLDPDKKLNDYNDDELSILRNGPSKTVSIEIRSNKSGRVDRVNYEGVIPRFKRLYLTRDITKLKKSLRDEIKEHINTIPCSICQGTGLNPKAIAFKINGLNIIEMMHMDASQLIDELRKITEPRGISIVNQLIDSLKRMVDIGIGYLDFARKTSTLSGGELQRIKIVRNLGGILNNVTYIFDEPTIGLHPSDISKIIKMLQQLRNAHNNVLVVEHSKQIMKIADEIIDIGPLAGKNGGKVVYQGDVKNISSVSTPTAEAINSRVGVNQQPLKWTKGFEIKNASNNNLKHLNITIPKNILTTVSGVAGSGKTSLIRGDFAKQYPGSIIIDQSPIGTSIRSTPATYTGVMDEIREVFSKKNNVPASWFSFNSKGACPVCNGKGKIKYDMAFADSVEVICEECNGRRYNETALGYLYNDKNIIEVLNMTIDEALNFFNDRKITKRLISLKNVGLGYLTLGQPTSTLSGGETQRIKIAAELTKKGNVYIFDEPSVGLHPKDVQVLNKLLRKLVQNRNTVITIEHNLDIIGNSDWVIDLGPKGGKNGGQLVFSGTPNNLLQCSTSLTAKYLNLASK
ncbi:ATP-binding cassette domain-containing protein [Companilactobacillus baiquanensis]|uniref:UvrABC system protein A n=1 Tax=Companilactobacillus baiquanensis TaxID=2486005 RepID=A0ABW1UUB6_9LACO|nr:excinuclease ABC subunit UvrA [Companilactobacillus baiquanensis]